MAVLDRNDVRRVLGREPQEHDLVSGAGAQGERLRDPRTWEELIALSDALLRDGETPGASGGSPAAPTGGPEPIDELLLLRGPGPRVYDGWATHEIPFDSPPVRQAFERLGQILFTEGYTADGAVEEPFWSAQRPMVNKQPPGCWLYQFPTFGAPALPPGSVGESTNIFPFPSVGADSRGVVGGGTIGGASPIGRVRELVRYILSPAYGEAIVVSDAAFISANQQFDLKHYGPFERREATFIYAALADDAFRFDASDSCRRRSATTSPARYAIEGPESLDPILSELDAAWPDDG